MESIVIMVLLAIASSVFQAVFKGNKQSKEQVKPVPTVKPKLQPTVKTTVKPNNIGIPETMKKNTESPPKPKTQTVMPMQEWEESTEGVQTEALDDIVIEELKWQSESIENEGFFQEFTINDLQKSIVMAEVLGKPKALKRNRG